MDDVLSTIEELVARDLPTLAPHLREWFLAHRVIPPRLEPMADSIGSTTTVDLWLVTDHTGDRDSSSRVVFDPMTGCFGTAMDFAGGPALMGFVPGGLAAAIDAM